MLPRAFSSLVCARINPFRYSFTCKPITFQRATMSSLVVNDVKIPITLRPGPFKIGGKWNEDRKDDLMKDILKFGPLLEWVGNISESIKKYPETAYIESVEVTDADYFGSRLGFIKFAAQVYWSDTRNSIPGIVFCRGGAVSMMILLDVEGQHTEGDPYVLLTVQPRIPIGQLCCVELPAGMLDGDSNFSGVAAKEIEEETGLHIKNNLVNMNELCSKVPGSEFSGNTYLSGGGCDEHMQFFITRETISQDVFTDLQTKETGSVTESERIRLKVVRLSELWKATSDSKVFISLGLYHNLLREDVLPSFITKSQL